MLGTVLGGRYRIITILGAGGFGQTYLAEDEQQARRCVVKQFKPVSQDLRLLMVARRLFDTEVETLRRLGQHDQIPELYDSFQDGEEFYLVQEFIEGHALSEEFASGQRLSEPEAIALLQDVLGVLGFVHQNQVIHRDIKPANLIRRKADGKLVLIDFGAVKEIQTQLTGISGQTEVTVGIGTQGYTPSEQLMGRPRYCSDLYALGMTVVQAVTGSPPSQLMEDPETLDIIWQHLAEISPGLKLILDHLVRYDFSQRYQSVAEVQHALAQLAELPTDLIEAPTSLLPPAVAFRTQPLPPLSWRDRLRMGWKGLAIATAAAAVLSLGLKYLGWTEPLERLAYDQMTRLQPALPPDDRLLIVEISEADLQTLGRATPSDADVARVLQTLQRAEPRVIGLGLWRDLPQEPGRAALLEALRSPNVVTFMQLGSVTTPQIPPPPGVPPAQVGFSDLIVDADNVVRRGLIFGGEFHSFAMRLAQKYLTTEQVSLRTSPQNPGMTELGDIPLPPLESTSGGYQRLDAGGYQLLLRYRSPDAPAPMVGFADVLNGRVAADLVRDRIVLIGTTAPSGKDLYYTPFSAGQQADHQMPGVVVHTQMTSQLLSAVQDGRRLMGYWPDWAEGLWIVGWVVVGGGLGWFLRNPAVLAVGSVAAIGILIGGSVWLFGQQVWIPVATPAIALTLATVGSTASRVYRESKIDPDITRLTWDKTLITSLSRREP
ncbi:MAG: hypothetical protein OHK0037_28280 [Elainellaceae cyanobacterium]